MLKFTKNGHSKKNKSDNKENSLSPHAGRGISLKFFKSLYLNQPYCVFNSEAFVPFKSLKALPSR